MRLGLGSQNNIHRNREDIYLFVCLYFYATCLPYKVTGKYAEEQRKSLRSSSRKIWMH